MSYILIKLSGHNVANFKTTMPKTPKKILIVEDEKPIRQALELKLSKAGFSITPVSNGKDAISKVSEQKFDLILLDLMMPEMNGYEVLAQLKNLNIKTPVIILSNLGQEEDIKKAKECGAEDYCIKSNTPISSIVDKVKGKLK